MHAAKNRDRQKRFRSKAKFSMELSTIKEDVQELPSEDHCEQKKNIPLGNVTPGAVTPKISTPGTVTHVVDEQSMVENSVVDIKENSFTTPKSSLQTINNKTWTVSADDADLAVPLKEVEVQEELNTFPLETPLKSHRKSIHQRTSQLRNGKDMPKEKHMRAHVLVKSLVHYSSRCDDTAPLLKRYLLNDPKGKHLVQEWSETVRHEEKQLAKQVRNLAVFRSKKQHKKVETLFEKMTKTNSLRRIAKATNISYSHLHWLGNIQKPLAQKLKVRISPRANVTQVEKDEALAFFLQANITMQLPYKRTAHFRYMRTSMADAHKEYTKHQRRLGKRVLSITAVNRLLPKTVKPMSKIPYKQCLCSLCANFN